MANFKVGQRVRLVRVGESNIRRPGETINCLGREATIIALYSVGRWRASGETFVGHMIWVDGADRKYCAPPDWLVPLTDPKADAFLEAIRQLKPLSVRETA